MFNQSMLSFTKENQSFKIHFEHPNAIGLLSSACKEGISQRPIGSTVVIMCIGTDRSTGDSLGPLVGTNLSDKLHLPHIYGTLNNPVHAVNLEETLNMVAVEIANPFIIAIDACLGHHSSVGELTFAKGALKPGAGVNKVLPEVGNYHITGVVNVGGFMEYFVLQNTRLNLVFQMADIISRSIAIGLRSVQQFGIPISSAFNQREVQ